MSSKLKAKKSLSTVAATIFFSVFLSSLFSGFLILGGALATQVRAADEDPNLANKPSGVLAADAPASEAAAAEASATAASAAAPAASAPPPPPVAASVAAILLKPISQEKNQQYVSARNFALTDNLEKITVDSNGDPAYNTPKPAWRMVEKIEGRQTFADDTNSMFFEEHSRTNSNTYNVTFNRKTNRATLADFKGSTPASYTVLTDDQQFTVTDGFCKILEAQTEANGTADLLQKAQTCEFFYDRQKAKKLNPTEQKTAADVIRTHRANVTRLSKSVAASLVPKKEWLGYGSLFPKPDAVLTKRSEPEESWLRHNITEAARVCARMWPRPATVKKPEAATAAQPPKPAKAASTAQ